MLRLGILAFLLFSSSALNPLSVSVKKTAPLSAKSLPSPEESARALSEYMAKAHEDKLRAVAQCEKKYQAEIAELKEKLVQLEQNKLAAIPGNEPGSFAFPVTNKATTEKIDSYRKFIAKYIVSAQEDKRRAVTEAETKLRDYYEEKLQQKDRDSKDEDLMKRS